MLGQTISRYKILSGLGEVGMGVAYRAEDTKLGGGAALKFLSSETVGYDELRAGQSREAQA